MKTMHDVLNGVQVKMSTGNPELQIAGIKYNSNDIESRDCFVAIKGFKLDGNEFIADAIERGAVLIVSSNPPKEKFGKIAWIQVEDEREAMSIMSKNLYSISDSDVDIIGITGTNGKTTVALLIKEIISVKDKCGFIGTLGMMSGNDLVKGTLTTPESVEIFSFIDKINRNDCSNITMEVSSVALELDRVRGVNFSQAVFTNFSGDHLDFHKTLEKYFESKLKLFKELNQDKFAIVNLDDYKADEIIKNCRSKISTYGFNSAADIHPVEACCSMSGIETVLETPIGKIEIISGLIGKINLQNIMAAVASSIAANIPVTQIVEGVKRFSAPKGRLDFVYNQKFAVLIDYAHTDMALKKSLSSLKEILPPQGRLILVFGAGGDRDKTKRPRMGAVASEYSDLIILTNDNPRSETPQDIAKDVIKGFATDFLKYKIELDRKKAIYMAVKSALPGDLVVIAGKGHEDYQIFKGKTVHFDDFEIARESLERLNA